MIQRVSSDTNVAEILRKIGVDEVGERILQKKSRMNLFFIPKLDIKAANILKQDALSIGADLATSKEAASLSVEATDALLMCTDKQLEKLIKKEAIQPFGLKKISEKLSALSFAAPVQPRIMGILNANEDSFYESSRVDESQFVERFLQMAEEGADIIDIGAVSSKPGSEYPGKEEELKRLAPLLEAITKYSLAKKIKISVDTFEPKVAREALEAGCKIINDITGLSRGELAATVAEYKAGLIIMHMRGTPKDMQNYVEYDNLFLELESYFREKIEIADSFGITDITIDVGIGFSKLLSHNLLLIKHLQHFSLLKKPILVGASRKSMIDRITPCEPHERLAGTLALHQKALDGGAAIIRCHDVKEHVQMLSVWKALQNTTI